MSEVRITKTIYEGGKNLLKKGQIVKVYRKGGRLFYKDESIHFLPKDSYELYSGFEKNYKYREKN